MTDPRVKSSDRPLQETYEKALKKGRESHQKLLSFLVRPSSDLRIEDKYEILTGYRAAPKNITIELARCNAKTGSQFGSIFVRLENRGSRRHTHIE